MVDETGDESEGRQARLSLNSSVEGSGLLESRSDRVTGLEVPVTDVCPAEVITLVLILIELTILVLGVIVAMSSSFCGIFELLEVTGDKGANCDDGDSDVGTCTSRQTAKP